MTEAVENESSLKSHDFELRQLEEQAQQLDIEAGFTPDVEQVDGGDTAIVERNPIDAELLELVTNVIGVSAHTFAPNWQLEKSEINEVGKAYTKLLQKYLPTDGFSRYGDEINAAMITLIIFQKRAGMPRKVEKKADAGENGDQSTDESREPVQTVVNDTNSKAL